jgi:hypothetical protein
MALSAAPGVAGSRSLRAGTTLAMGKVESPGVVAPQKTFVVVRGTPVAPEISKLYVPTPLCKPEKYAASLTTSEHEVKAWAGAWTEAKFREAGAHISVGGKPEQMGEPGGSIPAGRALAWREALRLLEHHRISANRPAHLLLMPGSDRQLLFLERPAQKRRKGDDKWVLSGGRKGSTEWWTGNVGVRKRYGRVTCKGPGAPPPLKFAHYTLLRLSGAAACAADAAAQVVEDRSVVLFVATPSTHEGERMHDLLERNTPPVQCTTAERKYKPSKRSDYRGRDTKKQQESLKESSIRRQTTAAAVALGKQSLAAISDETHRFYHQHQAKRAAAPCSNAEPLPAEKKYKIGSSTELVARNQVPCVLSMTQLKPMLKARGFAPNGTKNDWLARLAGASPLEFGKYFGE